MAPRRGGGRCAGGARGPRRHLLPVPAPEGLPDHPALRGHPQPRPQPGDRAGHRLRPGQRLRAARRVRRGAAAADDPGRVVGASGAGAVAPAPAPRRDLPGRRAAHGHARARRPPPDQGRALGGGGAVPEPGAGDLRGLRRHRRHRHRAAPSHPGQPARTLHQQEELRLELPAPRGHRTLHGGRMEGGGAGGPGALARIPRPGRRRSTSRPRGRS